MKRSWRVSHSDALEVLVATCGLGFPNVSEVKVGSDNVQRSPSNCDLMDRTFLNNFSPQ